MYKWHSNVQMARPLRTCKRSLGNAEATINIDYGPRRGQRMGRRRGPAAFPARHVRRSFHHSTANPQVSSMACVSLSSSFS